MKPRSRPPHPFLPSDDNRHRAIVHAAQAVLEPRLLREKVSLDFHFATFRRRLYDILITYTPIHQTNKQCCDVVKVGAPAVGSL
jgi:hypothetical protein